MGTSSDSATIVGSLDTTVPADNGVDGKRTNGAAEIRQVKTALKTTFANVTGAVTATHTQLNQLATNTFTGSFTSPGIDDNADAVAVTIDSSERVGIGTTTPSQRLDVAGFIRSQEGSGSGATAQTFASNLVLDSDGSLGMAFLSPNTQGASIQFGDPEDNDVGSIGYNHASNFMQFTINADERVRIVSSGNVGIGETAPNYKLDVNGSFGFTPGASVTPADNGDVVFELTDNTTLTIKAKGSDGTVRTATVTLA